MTTNTNRPTDTTYSPEHPARMSWTGHRPEVYKAMVRLDQAAREGLEHDLLELVRIRASQLNHCAYCLDMHTKDALAAGESAQRIVQLAAWEESQHFYSERELAALALTEAVTVLTDGFVPDEVYAQAAKVFEEAELTSLISTIITINAWNRFAVTTRMVPGHYQPGRHK